MLFKVKNFILFCFVFLLLKFYFLLVGLFISHALQFGTDVGVRRQQAAAAAARLQCRGVAWVGHQV